MRRIPLAMTKYSAKCFSCGARKVRIFRPCVGNEFGRFIDFARKRYCVDQEEVMRGGLTYVVAD